MEKISSNSNVNNIEELRKKLSQEIERIGELEQQIADNRFKIISLQKGINIKKRTLPIKKSGTISSSIGKPRPPAGSAPRPSRARKLMPPPRPAQPKTDPDQLSLDREINSESKLAQDLEVAYQNAKVLAEGLATFDIGETVKLLSSDLPILLFPVRVETKFHVDNQGIKQLLVRIYPDKIAIETHENGLTEDEIESGKVYWRTLWYGGKSNTEAREKAWGALVSRYGKARADWIVRKSEQYIKNKDQWPQNPSNENSAPKPIFEPSISKPSSWTRAPSTHIMPDRWIVITYIGNEETHRVIGSPIPPKLNVGIDPMSQKEADIGGEAELKVDEGTKWMVDFTSAESKGMGIRITNLTPTEEEYGFTRIVVVGLKYSADENQSIQLVKDLFDSHHYTHGLAFVPQGTPTNNTSDKRSGFSSREDADYQNSSQILGTPLYNVTNDPYKAKDGEIVATALGLRPDFFVHIENSGLSEHQDARYMGIALWPCAGYFLEEIMRPILSIEDIILGRRFFIDNIRGRGPYSAIRVGNTPYGILPTSSFKRWVSVQQEDGKIESSLSSLIRTLYPNWEGPISDGRVPYVARPTYKPGYDELLNVLGTDPTSLNFQARILVGSEFLTKLLGYYGNQDIARLWWETHDHTASYLLNKMGYSNLEMLGPQIISKTFMASYKILLDTVSKPPLSEKEPLPENDSNYVKWLSAASLNEIKNKINFLAGKPNTLLYILLRYSVLREYVSTSFRILRRRALISQEQTREPELLPSGDNTNTVFSGLNKFVPGLSPTQTIEKYLDDMRTNENADVDEDLRELVELRESLKYLKDVPSAKLERLMSETLDLFSHRLDAWITALYTARLKKMRNTKRKEGIYIGGYGWVENLHPLPSNLKQPAAGEAVADLPDYTRSAIAEQISNDKILAEPVIPTTNAGFIHAPSLSQAAAAAILRNASISHRANGQDQFKVNLSSERVKRSLWFLEGIRQGQPLAALLGYRFERGLHENHQPLELDQYIQPLRDLFPLNPTESQDQSAVTTTTATNSPERIQARDVVNGLEMLKSWRKGEFPFTKLAIANSDEKLAIRDELQGLDNTMDAISDLTIAESVFQMVQGNYTALAANLDAYSRGERPPEPAIVKTPRSGTRSTHRVMLVLFEKQRAAPSNLWSRSMNNPRAKAEPDLNSWLAKVLGNPSKVVCKVIYKIASSSSSPNPSPSRPPPPSSSSSSTATTTATAATTKTGYVTLQDLELCPLDFLELSIAPAEHQQSEIDTRIDHFVSSSNPNKKDLEIVYAVPPDELKNDQVSFADALEFARKIRRFISSARKIMPEDLILPEETLGEGDSSAITKEVEVDLVNRIARIESELSTTISSLSTASTQSTLVQALKKASLFGVLGAFPDSLIGTSGGEKADYLQYLKGKADFTKTELEKRLERSTKLQYERTGYAAKIEIATAKAKEIFGSSFVVLPKFSLPSSKSIELNNSLGSSTNLLGGDEDAPVPWFQQAAKVRPLLSNYEDAMAFSEALKTDILRFKVAQIPFEQTDRWVALPFDKKNIANKKLTSGKLSFVISPYGSADFAGKISGLFIDDWIEFIPDDDETTGVTFHFDVPNSEAPQALLLAVPPGKGPTWELDDVIAVVNETLDLAKIRAVDLEMVDAVAQFLPALYFTSGAATDSSLMGRIIDADIGGSNNE
jgi:hypothetical protein